MRKKILAFTSAFVLAPAVLFAGAAPVAAHNDATSGFSHTACPGGIVAVVDAGVLGMFSGPGKGPAGEFIRGFATLEPGALAFGVDVAHGAICDLG